MAALFCAGHETQPDRMFLALIWFLYTISLRDVGFIQLSADCCDAAIRRNTLALNIATVTDEQYAIQFESSPARWTVGDQQESV